MTTKPATQPPPKIAPVTPPTKVERLPNPKRKPDAMSQFPHIARVCLILETHFRGHPDALVGSRGYFCRYANDRSDYVAPDCIVAFGVDPEYIRDVRNGYVISEVGKPPEFVLEVASESTAKLDYTVKPGIYAGFGVAEYWRFDRTGGQWHDAPMAGDRLVDGAYQPIELTTREDGLIWGRSDVLGLDLCWDRGWLRFYDPAAGEYLPDLMEAIGQRDAADARAAVEAARAEAAANRAAEAEAELIRLRAQLGHS